MDFHVPESDDDGAAPAHRREGERSDEIEGRIAQLAVDLLGLAADQIDTGIDQGLESAGRLLGAREVQIISIDGSPGSKPRCFRWDDGHVSVPDVSRLPKVAVDHSWCAGPLVRGEVVSVGSIDALPPDAESTRESFRRFGIGAFLAIPVRSQKRLLGLIHFQFDHPTQDWEPHKIHCLKMLASVLIGAIQRRDAEAQRRESADRYRALTENSRDILCEFDDRGRLLYASPRIEEIVGYSPVELLEIGGHQLIAEEHRPTVRNYIAATPDVDRDEPPVQFVVQHRDGHDVWLEASRSAFTTADGERRVVAAVRDITRRRRAQLQLERRLERETLIAELARRFVQPATTDFEENIAGSLESAAAIADADRCYLMSMDMALDHKPVVYEWCAPGVSPLDLDLTRVAHDDFAWSLEHLLQGDLMAVPCVADLPPEASAEHRLLEAAGVVSYIGVPIHSEGEFLGCLAFHYVKEQSWSQAEFTQLRLLGGLFTSALRRKLNFAALIESEERFRALAEHSRDPICEVDQNGIVLYASPSFEELLGFAPSEFLGARFVELVNVADIGTVLSSHLSTLAGREGGTIMFRARNRIGADIFFEATSQSYTTASGEARVVYVLRDVTERQRSQRALELQLRRERQLADLSRGLLATRAEAIPARIEKSLEVAAHLAGADRSWYVSFSSNHPNDNEVFYWYDETLVGVDNSPPRVSTPDFERIASRLQETPLLHFTDFDEIPEEDLEIRERMKGRGVRSFLAFPMFSANTPVAFLGFEVVREQHDWSEEESMLLRMIGEIFVSALDRRRYEQALRDSQHQLLQSQKMEAVGTLAGGIAHDFNNHLAVMLGNARYVLERIGEDEEAQDALADLHRSAEHCSQLTRSLLAFSRQTPVLTQAIDVSWIVDEARELLRPLLPASIELDVRCGEGMDLVIADPTKLQQVLVNLAVNARDAMPDGGRLTLATQNRRVEQDDARRLGLESPGSYIELEVVDDGAGIEPTVVKRIFEPFFTTKAPGKGTGLGLATAYGIVRESGGAIEVESTLGVGTRFRILLPRASESDVVAEPESGPIDRRGYETILLVEDESGVRRLLKRILSEQGYKVLTASDGAEGLAIAQLHSQPIHAMISDLSMPNMGGLELAEHIAEIRPDTRVLFLSGYADLAADLQAQSADYEFLQKPFDDEELLALLRVMLAGRR